MEAETKWPQCSRWHIQMHFLEWKLSISIKISLKFVPKGPVNNIATLVQIMAWCRPCDKLLSEPMVVSVPTHKCLNELINGNSGFQHWQSVGPAALCSWSLWACHLVAVRIGAISALSCTPQNWVASLTMLWQITSHAWLYLPSKYVNQVSGNMLHALITLFASKFFISMGWCKKDVTPVRQQWSYAFLALTHRYKCWPWSHWSFFFRILIFYHFWVGTRSRDPCSWKMMSHSSCIFNIIASDHMTTQGARASGA